MADAGVSPDDVHRSAYRRKCREALSTKPKRPFLNGDGLAERFGAVALPFGQIVDELIDG
jgi:hypothetical protein